MRLSSTLARGLVELPEPPGPIGMYVCGPTVYARAHIGNARPYVLGVWYARWLRSRGFKVTLVHNITDVGDRIYETAPGASAERARQATEWYLEDVGRFGLDEVDHYPKATETMPEIVHFISDLIERDFAYEVEGDVYFRVSKQPEYGRLSGQRPDQVEEQEPNVRKEDPRDFALWKANKPDEDTWWDSPWGRGRPGWHIECSAMAEKLLGPAFEIHGGGLDLVFPHHENELAQSSALGHEFARIWMHNGMLRFTGEKMSKSVGNVETIQEVLEKWGRETTLLFFLTAHWHSPIDFSDERMAATAAQLQTFRNALMHAGSEDVHTGWDAFADVLDDDFNTPLALSLMHEWRDAGRTGILQRALNLFGISLPMAVGRSLVMPYKIYGAGTPVVRERIQAPPNVETLAERRAEARAAHDFAESDRLRGEIEAAGWEVRDETDAYRLVPKA